MPLEMTMIRILSPLFIEANHILQTEGLIPLLRRGFVFLVRHYFFQCRTVYLYEHMMGERNEADFVPKIQNFTFKIVSTNQQADELAADGLVFYLNSIYVRRSLDKGAIAFCISIGRELAHVGWIAMTEEAKNTFDPLPYRVNFLDKEACTGGTWTNPKYRGKGLMTYGYFKRFQFLRERGIIASRNAVTTRNVVSHKVHAKFGPTIYAKARYLKILWWKFWKETPLTETSHHD